MSGFIPRVLFYAAAGLAGAAAHAADNPAPEVGSGVDARFYLATRAIPDYVDRDARGTAIWSAVQSFYRTRDYRLAWVAGGVLSPDAEAVARIVARAEGEGVASGFNGVRPNLPDVVQDVHLTYSFLKYAADLSGRFDPKAAGPFWLTRPPPRDLAPWLEQALESRQVVAGFAALSPEPSAYDALKQALLRYRAIERNGGWPVLPPRLALRRGSRSPHVSVLRARLAAEGHLPSPPAAGASDVYDPALVEAVKVFERRHGLAADGALDSTVVAALNVSVGERIRQIELNLERWRWLPRDRGRRSVVVNVPSFQLTAYDDRQPTLTMKVVTGTPDSPTPVFSGEMTTVVFSPYWNVPPTIAADEIIPAVLRDPGYLRRHDLELLRGTQVVGHAALRRGDVQIRQRPGTRNALGLVKFVFPNPFNVYLHDTPADALFARPSRAFSHGCVRVEKPFELARWVLSGLSQWTPRAVNAAMRSGRERHLALPEPIPIYVTYQTVEATADGAVFFWPDVYGHDRAQMPLLPGPSPLVPDHSIARDAGRAPSEPVAMTH
jgi:murein L,D-transpeptidase YcbB/YkuD